MLKTNLGQNDHQFDILKSLKNRHAGCYLAIVQFNLMGQINSFEAVGVS